MGVQHKQQDTTNEAWTLHLLTPVVINKKAHHLKRKMGKMVWNEPFASKNSSPGDLGVAARGFRPLFASRYESGMRSGARRGT